MRGRSFSIILLVFAFLLSLWSNVIAAAFCTRYSSSRNCHSQQPHIKQEVKQVDHTSSCQHEMSDMEMGDMEMDYIGTESEAASQAGHSNANNSTGLMAPASLTKQLAMDFHTEPCKHCWMHSRPQLRTITLVAIDPSKRLVEANTPLAEFVAPLPSAFSVPLIPLEHGPPGDSFPRHILINVFRI